MAGVVHDVDLMDAHDEAKMTGRPTRLGVPGSIGGGDKWDQRGGIGGSQGYGQALPDTVALLHTRCRSFRL